METETHPKVSPFNLAALKNGLKKYGRTGVVVYLGLSTCVTASMYLAPLKVGKSAPSHHKQCTIFIILAGFYVAIEQHVDVKKILGIKGEQQAWYHWAGIMGMTYANAHHDTDPAHSKDHPFT